MPKKNHEKHDVGMDDLTQDVLGLNISGLRTMWAMFVSPKPVFQAARTSDWADRKYTPTIRLVFSLLALSAALRFIWGSDDGQLHESLVERLRSGGRILDPTRHAEIASQIVDHIVLLYPIITMIAIALLASVLRVFGKHTGYSLRIRLVFACIIPSMTLAIVTLPMMILVPISMYALVSIGSLLLSLGADFTTALRGGVSANGIGVKILKALTLAVTTQLVSFIGALGASSLATYWVMRGF